MMSLKIVVVVVAVVGVGAVDVKKGVGCSDTCLNTTLAGLTVSWYYNWNSYTNLTSQIPFIPMCYSGKQSRIDNLPTSSPQLLGFNQPDNSNQANMTVDDAYLKWSQLVAKSVEIASPSMAGNPVSVGSWLETFMAKGPKVDYIAVHWYGGNYPSSFKTRMQDIYNKYQKPIWITQFACQTYSSSVSNPTKYTQDEVNSFLDNVIPWLQTTPWIYRYAWHDSQVGTSALWYDNGTLTPTGIKYGSF